MAISIIFVAVSSIFRFASFAKNLKGEDDEEFFVPVSALRSAKGSWFLYKSINSNLISFDQTKVLS